MKEPLLPVPSALPITLLPFHAWKTGKNHKEQDVTVLRGHLTGSNLLFVRRFTYQNKENFVPLFDFGGTFSIRACVKELSPKIPSLGRVLITNALLILIEPLGKFEK